MPVAVQCGQFESGPEEIEGHVEFTFRQVTFGGLLKIVFALFYIDYRTTMIKSMLFELETLCDKSEDHTLTECLMQGSKSRKYIPLMQRQKCGKFLRSFIVKILFFVLLQKVWKAALNTIAKKGNCICQKVHSNLFTHYLQKKHDNIVKIKLNHIQ